MSDAFSTYHPAVNFLFFVGAIGCGAVFLHPAYLIIGILCATAYYMLLTKGKGAGSLLMMLPFILCTAFLNPFFNTQGSHILFYIFQRPYTLEALLYGFAGAGMLLTMYLWFGCYGHVLTGDKFTCLFGNMIPSLSLLLVMIFRLVPNLIHKTQQIRGARRSIGKGENKKLNEGMTVLGTLISWALEGGVITSDSMRSRGYGAAKRQSFLIYRMKKQDWWLLTIQLLLLATIVTSACLGQANAIYTPEFTASPLSWGVISYGIFLSIPLALNIKEAIEWHISRSKI